MLRFMYLILLIINCISTILGDFEHSYPEYDFHFGGHNLKWPCQSTKNIYLQTGRYIPKNVIATRGQISKQTLLLAMPRLRPGVPMTLGQVQLKKNECQASIAPFPSWTIQEEGNCESFQSVVDLTLDPKYGTAWVLDTGLVHTLEQPIRRCPPKVIGIKIATGKIIKQIDLSNLVLADSLLQFILFDYSANGTPFIYISDAKAHSIIVYNLESDASHRIVLPTACQSKTSDVLYMAIATSPPNITTTTTASTPTTVSSSTTTMLTPSITKSYNYYNEKSLYFTYLDSTELYAIETKHLQYGIGSGSVIHIGTKPYPFIILGSNQYNQLIIRMKGQSDLYTWKTCDCLKMSNFYEIHAGGDCRLSTHVIKGTNNYMWSLESNFQDYINGTTGCNGASVKLFPFTIDKKIVKNY